MQSYNSDFTLYFKTRGKAVLARGEEFNYFTDYPQDLYIYNHQTKSDQSLISYDWFPSKAKQIIENYHERLAHIHCKDIRKSVLENSLKKDLSFRGAFLDGAFTVPGDGCIDYKPLFDVLKEKNYSSWLVVEAEQDPKKANPLEYAIKGYKYLTETLSTSNIDIDKN